jgi:hypothetical protein
VKYEEDSRSSRLAPQIRDRVRPVRGRKNRRRWCRGKVGVEHELELTVWDIYLSRGITECYRYQPGKRWTRWVCVEQERCTQCGKILRHTLGPECTKREAGA